MKAQVLTPWCGTGKESDPFRPRLDVDYGLLSWVDVTYQVTNDGLPDPNLYVVECECTPEVLDAIEADNAYFVLRSGGAA